MSDPLLSAHKLSRVVNGKAILDDINLELGSGELLGIIGPNGAGKSSLVRLLANLHGGKGRKHSAMAGMARPTRGGGERYLQGKAYDDWGSQDFARCLAYLEQDAQIHWPLPVERVVSLGRLPWRRPFQTDSAEDRRIVYDAMGRCDILHLAERSVEHLSAGEKALVNLARVLAGQPRLIIADEPAAALDPYHQLLLMEILQDLARGQHQAGAMVVLHDLNLAARFCDRLLLLHQGKVVTCGSPEQVLTPDTLKTIYHIETAIMPGEYGPVIASLKRQGASE